MDGDGNCDDVYECLVFSSDCTEVVQEILWYGCPAGTGLPEDCDSGGCEPAHFAGATVPGHPKTVDTIAHAWGELTNDLGNAGIHPPVTEKKVYVIPADNHTKLSQPVYIMIVKVPTAPPGKTSKVIGDRYFAIEIDKPGPNDPDASAIDLAPIFNHRAYVGPGSQLRIDFEVNNETRRVFVWRKR